jgi:hypothetical protein
VQGRIRNWKGTESRNDPTLEAFADDEVVHAGRYCQGETLKSYFKAIMHTTCYGQSTEVVPLIVQLAENFSCQQNTAKIVFESIARGVDYLHVKPEDAREIATKIATYALEFKGPHKSLETTVRYMGQQAYITCGVDAVDNIIANENRHY